MSDREKLTEFFASVGNDAPPSTVMRQATQSESTTATSAGPVSAWATSGNKFWGISESLKCLEPGCYLPNVSNSIGVFLERQPLVTDELLTLPDSKSEAIIKEIEEFTLLRPKFEARGLLYKRGVLLWGPPGSGKTSTLHLLMKLIVDRNGGIALMIHNPGLATEAIRLIRSIEPDRQIIGIMEDMDGLIQSWGIEQYLALLDGESQTNNVIFVATTNYPERLDRRLVDRPSRFDTVEYVGMPTAEARRAYLRFKEPSLSEADVEQMVALSDDFSIAHLREFIILTQCFGRSIEDAAERLAAGRKRKLDSDYDPKRAALGFGQQRPRDVGFTRLTFGGAQNDQAWEIG